MCDVNPIVMQLYLVGVHYIRWDYARFSGGALFAVGYHHV